MLLSMIFTAIIATIFHEVAIIAFLQFDVIHSGDAAVSTHNVWCLCHAAHFYLGHPIDESSLPYAVSQEDISTVVPLQRRELGVRRVGSSSLLWQFFGAGAFGQFGGEKGERKRRRKFEGASLHYFMQRISLITLPNIIIWSFQCAIIILINLERDNFPARANSAVSFWFIRAVASTTRLRLLHSNSFPFTKSIFNL